MEVMREKQTKVKTGSFTSWQGYSNQLSKHKILVIAS